MTNEPENPLAFPHIVECMGMDTFRQVTSGGMTLRDYFAAAALPAIISGVCARQHQVEMKEGEISVVPGIARGAYELADAMLAAREQTRKAGE